MNNQVLNLSIYDTTPSQTADGVIDFEYVNQLKQLLLFTNFPTKEEVVSRAKDIVDLVKPVCDELSITKVMLGTDNNYRSAPYLLRHLEEQLEKASLTPVWSWTSPEYEFRSDARNNMVSVMIPIHRGFIE